MAEEIVHVGPMLVLFWAAISADVGMVVVLVSGCGGGTLAIIGQRQLWRSITS